ncbi:MAG: FhlB domain-containing protein [Clostridia bacterium]|nr:FhlB domain-containing protein [Clostridia bacterium]
MSEKEKKPSIKYAAALKYKQGEDDVPRVVALGKGAAAKKIIETAKKHNIPIHEDPDLVYALSTLEIGQEIPPELYRAVAEVLAFIMVIDKKTSERMGI